MLNQTNIQFLLDACTLIAVILSLVYTLGVVWRVEEKLDLTFKLFFGALVFFLFSEIVKIIPGITCCLDQSIFNLGADVFRFLFVLCFLAGILETRGMIRKMDGEK